MGLIDLREFLRDRNIDTRVMTLEVLRSRCPDHMDTSSLKTVPAMEEALRQRDITTRITTEQRRQVLLQRWRESHQSRYVPTKLTDTRGLKGDFTLGTLLLQHENDDITIGVLQCLALRDLLALGETCKDMYGLVDRLQDFTAHANYILGEVIKNQNVGIR